MILQEIIDDCEEFLGDHLVGIAAGAAAIAAVAWGMNFVIGSLMPPKIEYMDVNKDGITDKVSYQRKYIYPKIYEKNDVFIQYGIKLPDGKTIYLSADQISGLEGK